MNHFRTRKAALRGSIGTVVIVLLFAFSAAVYAQNRNKDEKKGGAASAPARSAAPARQAQPARQTNAQPTGRTTGRATPQTTTTQPTRPATTTTQPTRPATTTTQPTRPTTTTTTQPTRPTTTTTTQPTRPATTTTQPTRPTTTTTTQPTRPTTTTTTQPTRPTTTTTTQPTRPTTTTTTQPTRPTTTQTTPPNTGQPGRQNTGQFGRQNTGQTTSPNTNQPGRQNTGQQFGRQNTGQTTPPNTGQPGRQFGQPQVTRYPNGRPQTVRTPNGGMVNRDQSGRVREVHTPGGAVITHRPDGVRRVEVARPGNQRIVTSAGGRGGYAQRPLTGRGQGYVQRTYYSHGQAYARVYRPYTYRGVVLNMYTPVRFYRPAFYAYAYSPWLTPVSYGWGWAGSPWFGFYGGYFSPYRVYAGPAFWLTDYLFAMTLQEAFQERMDANLQGAAYAAGPVGLTPDVKQAVADEVHRQLDLERAEGQSGAADMAPIFADNIPHVFVVSSSLLADDRGPGCPVSEGDVLQLRPGSSNGAAADVVVLASKGGDCRRGSVVSVQLQDLQEMQNHMRATIDQGLAEMQTRQGKGGLPPLPAAAAAPPVDSPIAAAVQPDANVATELSQAAQEATQGEQEVVDQSAPVDAGNAAGPVTISLGQSIADVESMNGKPDKVIDLGAKKIYVYKDLKITFTDGRVSDVQ
jgi:hypothetical protein